ncbi:hypothetical protein H4217_000148 [Coemansia sp. RSA 1939]|nr:hypothetical protein H4217_000148 [Coemansia sp. RSA 1939]KAJ2617953.1 hypothetical protein EV177_000263 [Coemansia sp. RSA 1804]
MLASTKVFAALVVSAVLAAAAPYLVPDSTSESQVVPAPKAMFLSIDENKHQKREMVTMMEEAVVMATIMERGNGMVTMMERDNGMVTMLEDYAVPPGFVKLLDKRLEAAENNKQVRAVASEPASSTDYGNSRVIMAAIAAKGYKGDVIYTTTATKTVELATPSVGNPNFIMAAIAAKADANQQPSTQVVTVTVEASVPSVGDPDEIMAQIAVGNFNEYSKPTSVTLNDINPSTDIYSDATSSDDGADEYGKVYETSKVPCSFYDGLASLSITLPSDNCVPDPGDSGSSTADSDSGTEATDSGSSSSSTSTSDGFAAGADTGVGDEDNTASVVVVPTSDAETVTDTDTNADAGSDGYPTETTITSDSSAYKCVIVTTTVWASY